MEIRNIISFIKVNELSSFSKAAKELGYTQSNITMHIKQLEDELDCILFDRYGKSIYLTEYGKMFLPHAMKILSCIDKAKHCVDDELDIPTELRIGILESLCTRYMPDMVIRYHELAPHTNTIIKIGTFSELSEMLDNNTIDLLWTFDHPIQNTQWIKAHEHMQQLYVVTCANSPLAGKKNLKLDVLNDSNFIFTEKNCSYRNYFENILKVNNINYRIFMEIGNTEIIKRFVSSGLCICVLPEFAIQTELEQNSLCFLTIEDFSLHMYSQVFYHKNKYLSASMTKFIELINTYFKNS